MAKTTNGKDKKLQLKQTRERMDEAQDRLVSGELPEEEEENIRIKNKHRQEQIAGLESELDDGEPPF